MTINVNIDDKIVRTNGSRSGPDRIGRVVGGQRSQFSVFVWQQISAVFVYRRLRTDKSGNVNVGPIYWFCRENISSRAFPISPLSLVRIVRRWFVPAKTPNAIHEHAVATVKLLFY